MLLPGVGHGDGLLVCVIVHAPGLHGLVDVVVGLHGQVDSLGRLQAPRVHQRDVRVEAGVTLDSEHLACREVRHEKGSGGEASFSHRTFLLLFRCRLKVLNSIFKQDKVNSADSAFILLII